MSAPAYTVPGDRIAGEVLVEMLDRGVRHFPVLSPTGALLGVVDDIDLVAAERRTPFYLRTAIIGAANAERARARRARPPAHRGRAARRAGRGRAHRGDHLGRRRRARPPPASTSPSPTRGEPPAPFAWLALGSIARREAVPSSDVDCAIAWDGDDSDPEIRAYMHRVAVRVLDGLAACGLRSDPKGATASHRLFARSLDAWGEAIDSWFDEPTQEKALILVSIVGDNRPVWGVLRAAPLAEHVRAARSRPGLLRLMARYALSYRPPTGFLRDIVVEHSGDHKGRLDLKHGGLLPITDLARWAGMAAGATEISTRGRLRAAREAGVLTDSDGRVLEEAFALVGALRLDHQVEQIRAGRAARRPPAARGADAADAQLPQGRLPRGRVRAAPDRHRDPLRRRVGDDRRRERVLLQVDAGLHDVRLGAARADERDADRQAAAGAEAGRERRDREAGRVPGEREQDVRVGVRAAPACSRSCAPAPGPGSWPRAGGRCPPPPSSAPRSP